MEPTLTPRRIIHQPGVPSSGVRGGIMPALNKLAGVPAILLLAFATAVAKPPAGDRDSVVIVFKDGHRQSLSMAEIARVEVKPPAAIVYKDGHREKLRADIDRIEFGAT